MSIESIVEEISTHCLKGHKVPEALKCLWLEQLADNPFLESCEFGETTLIKSYPSDIFQCYTSEFAGLTGKEAAVSDAAWNKMFNEIGFFAMEADGALIGLWFYDAAVTAETAPVIILDNEGQFYLLSATIKDYPVATADRSTNDDERDEVYTIIKAWLSKYNLGEFVLVKAFSDNLDNPDNFPNPEERFDQYYETCKNEQSH